jgi:hypothetical protein
MFKPFDELWSPSELMAAIGGFDRHGNFIPGQLRQYYDQMAALTLPADTPQCVREYFDGVRMLWVHGFVYYLFFTWAALHAGLCAEMALRLRAEAAGEIKVGDGRVGLRSLLERARARGWLRGEGFAHVRRLHAKRAEHEEFMRQAYANSGLPEPSFVAPPSPEAFLELLEETFPEMRNWQAHPRDITIFPPQQAALTIELARDLVAQLFQATVASTMTSAR